MAATKDRDKARIELETALAYLVRAEDHLQVAATRIANRLRTLDEADDLHEIAQATASVEEARRTLAGFHPNRLKR